MIDTRHALACWGHSVAESQNLIKRIRAYISSIVIQACTEFPQSHAVDYLKEIQFTCSGQWIT
jgi:hypothetical protein